MPDVKIRPWPENTRVSCGHEDGCDRLATAVVVGDVDGCSLVDPVCDNEAHAAAAAQEMRDDLSMVDNMEGSGNA